MLDHSDFFGKIHNNFFGKIANKTKIAIASAILSISGGITTAYAAEISTLNLCTGGSKGNYFFAGNVIQKQSKGTSVQINVIETSGSIDNLRRMEDGTCDAGIVQSDAYVVYRDRNPSSALNTLRVSTLYKEYPHLVCNRKTDVSSVKGLRSGKVKILVGDVGSGSEITWQTWVKMDKDYTKAPTERVGGTQAVLRVADGSEAGCMMFVAGLKSPAMMGVDQQVGDKLHLIPVKDGDFASVKDPAGNKVYTYTEIPSGTYKNLQDGFFSSAVTTLAVDAVLVVTSSWADTNKRGMDDLTDSVMYSLPSIKARVGQ